ncbi:MULTISPECIES: energy transducer TonB [unclassified Psychrobacter]|uniref:energy transducer TonB n=1 Tax=unclassified Psychrobacter TaxID=196806 RepID=UPI0018F4B898|nr:MULTISPECIES: energy transducer TonB [unclassified Psychrobacter]
MNTAPSVFVPVQPKGDGLSAPTLLSLLAHGVILGLLIYNYHADDLTPTGSLETTMVSPEQLAAIQGQVLANRAAAQAAASSQSDNAINSSDAMAAPSDGSDNVNTSPQRRSVFTESNEPVYTSNNRPLLMSEEQQEQILKEMEDYERESEAWAREMDAQANQRIEEVDDQRQRDQDDLQHRLKAYQDSYDNPPPRIERPKAPARNNSDGSSSGNSQRNFDLADGTSTVPNSGSQTTSPRTGNSNSAGGSSGASDAQILAAIRKQFKASEGRPEDVILTITVDPSGRVINVEPDKDTIYSREAVRAAKAVGRFDIDNSSPKYPTFTITFRGSN